MVIEAEIINQPNSGEYKERIYDIVNEWNSQFWTFVKFIDEDYSEWCGQFRGSPRQIAVSLVNKSILVLTSDYLYHLNRENAELIEFEQNHQYHFLIATPNGFFVIADYYNLDKINGNIANKSTIEAPIQMDLIKFKNWNNTKFEFTCDEFLNWDNHLTMSYDCETNKIEIISKSK